MKKRVSASVRGNARRAVSRASVVSHVSTTLTGGGVCLFVYKKGPALGEGLSVLRFPTPKDAS